MCNHANLRLHMITKETCVKIWHCHNEIEKAKKLIQDMAKVVKKDTEKKMPELHNAFGDKKGLQLGIPSGDSSHTLYNVSPVLAVKMLEQHMIDQEKRLEELETIAKLELA